MLYILIFLFLVTNLSFGQKQDFYSYLTQLELEEDYQKILDTIVGTQGSSGEILFFKASALENLNQEDSAFFYYKEALEDFQIRGIIRRVAETNFQISSILESQNNLETSSAYFNKFWNYANATNDLELLAMGYNYLGRKNFETEDTKMLNRYFELSHELYDSIGNKSLSAMNLMNIGVVYSNRIGNNDSASYYYFKALDVLKENRAIETNKNLYHNLLNNIGNNYRRSKNYNKALYYYTQAETLQIKKYRNKTKKILYGNMDLTYYYLGDYKKAYNYLYKYDSIKDVINLAQQNATILDIQEKYNNQKLRVINLEIESKRQQNRNLLMLALVIIGVGGVIAILLQKNTTKKRLLAEQEAILKQQRVENLLKEQELVSIDAMIAGQEKERQKVAGELHDDLGSLMATIKLHFDNAKISKKDASLRHAQKLLEEAYQKVRSMAHSKNSGVMSDQGLLPAIKKMANTITGTGALEVAIEDFGLGERMENSLELSIFRMVQELVANAIKHAEATKVNIQLTQHEDTLNIIVEDNGKGFDRSKLDKNKSGMGLTNIEKRVEHLEGNFTVDSIVGKGTAILIDLPV